MAKSTGIVLAATGISFANEWFHSNTPNFRILVAGCGVALLFDGIEILNERAAVGLSYIMLTSVLLTPIDGAAPAQTVAAFLNPATKKPVSTAVGQPGKVRAI